jgi:hypothetical protein
MSCNEVSNVEKSVRNRPSEGKLMRKFQFKRKGRPAKGDLLFKGE